MKIAESDLERMGANLTGIRDPRRAGNGALVFNALGKAALRKLRALKVENRRRYSGRMRMMRAALEE